MKHKVEESKFKIGDRVKARYDTGQEKWEFGTVKDIRPNQLPWFGFDIYVQFEGDDGPMVLNETSWGDNCRRWRQHEDVRVYHPLASSRYSCRCAGDREH